MLSEDELQSVLQGSDADLARSGDVDSGADIAQENEELSLVSTQALRRILGEPEPAKKKAQDAPKKPTEGFDPYNTG